MAWSLRSYKIKARNTKNFEYSEFECRCGCGTNHTSMDLVRKLQKARGKAGIPFHISSGTRCSTHNKAVGGKCNSSHLHGVAVDIRVTRMSQRFTILTALIAVGFTRIGIDKQFIHVDIDTVKPARLVWVY